MPRTSRRRRSTGQQDEGFALLAVAIGALLYRQLNSLAWQWQITLVVLGASIALIVIRALVQYARRRRRQRILLTDALALSPSDFELRIKYLLQESGWEQVTRVGGSGDGGVDLRGVYHGESCIVQCKRYRGRVEPKYIRELEGARLHERADRAFLITTGYFTSQGYDWVRGKPIELWDGKTLAERFHQQAMRAEQAAPHQRRGWYRSRLLAGLAALNVLLIAWASLAAQPTPAASADTPRPTASRAPEAAAARLEPPVVSAATDQAPSAGCARAIVSGVERLVLRAAPGLNTERLSDYPAGTAVTVLCTRPVEADGVLWQQVRVADREGWMSQRFLK